MKYLCKGSSMHSENCLIIQSAYLTDETIVIHVCLPVVRIYCFGMITLVLCVSAIEHGINYVPPSEIQRNDSRKSNRSRTDQLVSDMEAVSVSTIVCCSNVTIMPCQLSSVIYTRTCITSFVAVKHFWLCICTFGVRVCTP